MTMNPQDEPVAEAGLPPAPPVPAPPAVPAGPPPLGSPSAYDPAAQQWSGAPVAGVSEALPGTPYWPGEYAPPAAAAPPGPPRVWPALVVPAVAVVAAVVASTVAIVVAAVVEIGPAGMQDQAAFMQWVKSYGGTPRGFLVLVLPGQLTFLAAALIAAIVSPVPFARRLGLRRPSIPLWGLPLLVLGTFFAGMCGDLLTTGVFGEGGTSDHLEMIYNLFRGPTGAFLVLVTLGISVLPGVSEELLFRGYSQTRLLQRWHPLAAVGLSSVFFAAAHLDPRHVIGVIPLGIWFGVIAWLCGSVWPSMLCHFVNNALAVLLVNAGIVDVTEHVRFNAEGMAMLGVTGALAAVAVLVMWAYRAPTPREISGGSEPRVGHG